MTKFTRTDFEDAIAAIWEQFHKQKDGPEKENLRRLGRELEKKKAIAFAEMLLEEMK